MTGKRARPIWSAAAVFSSGPRRSLRGPRRHIKTFLIHQKVPRVASAATSNRRGLRRSERKCSTFMGPVSPALFFLGSLRFPIKESVRGCVRGGKSKGGLICVFSPGGCKTEACVCQVTRICPIKLHSLFLFFLPRPICRFEGERIRSVRRII